MATKDLSRTVIEGGRYYPNCRERRYSNKQARVAANAVFAKMCDDPAGDALDPPLRRPVWKCFRDKLGPARRWLSAQAGRPWDAVRSEIFSRFDTRTTAGRHIVFCHILYWVEAREPRSYRVWTFHVDKYGILRCETRARKRRIPRI